PDARVATQPPTLLTATDCGQWPMVSPWPATACSASSPFLPASNEARRLTASIDRTAFIAPISSRIASGEATTPPTTPLPRPNGMTLVAVPDAYRRVACTSPASAGRATH